jgi:Fe-S-cluster containining protein
MTPGLDRPELDVRLLKGFGFACRPDCGLCCYAEPRVEAAEKRRLLEIVPEAEFVGRPPDEFLLSATDGGACGLLSNNRCSAHLARPHPCREFPVTAHLGTRLQATVVLSCPGVDISSLATFGSTKRSSSRVGFLEELAALRERVGPSTSRRLEASDRRHRKIARRLAGQGRWRAEEDVRDDLRRSMPLPGPEDFPVPDPPSAEDGLELLPLFYDGRPAPVALGSGLGGWELGEISPSGGLARPLGVFPPPDRPPPLQPSADAILRGYLRYWLERDALFGSVHLRMLDSTVGTVIDWVDDELRAIGALVLARAEIRAKLSRGVVDRLSTADLIAGVRATDQDLLDRETWGDRL